MAGCIHHQLGHAIADAPARWWRKAGYNTVEDNRPDPYCKPSTHRQAARVPARASPSYRHGQMTIETYPTEFAPFVNTVQQAMMDTVFCLIGFSGNDPNFLHWADWVRDNLGESAPGLYLAGWLDQSLHRRRMLEDRDVVPIDLAHHPEAHTWPEHIRHRYETEPVLHTLESRPPL